MKRALVMLAAASTLWLSASVLAQNGNRAAGHANTLTPQEQKEGWVLLFDGKTLDKWNVTPALAKVWKVVDGTIKADLSDAGGTMLTKDTLRQFRAESGGSRAPGHQLGHHAAQSRRLGRRRRPARNRRRIPAAPATSCRFATGIPATTAAATS